jgi:hypothetical protein
MVGVVPCKCGSIPFSDCLQSNCGILVDAKGPPIVDAKGRLSQVAQDVLSMHVFLLFSPNVTLSQLVECLILTHQLVFE